MNSKLSNNHFYDLLGEIEKRPALYLGSHFNLWTLFILIDGYNRGAGDEYPSDSRFNNFKYFSAWLHGHIERPRRFALGWWGLLNPENEMNDEIDDESFQLFFKYLNTFKNDDRIVKSYSIKPQIVDLSFMNNNGIQCVVKQKINRFHEVRYKSSKTLWCEYCSNDSIFYSQYFLNKKEMNDNLKVEL